VYTLRSTLTSKGQTTIPAEVRRQLGLKAGDGLVYTVKGEKVIIEPVHGTLLDAYASVEPGNRPEDFSKVRRRVRRDRARKRAKDR
jgi:AbrB family looped-hinge helix DNA binding protein